MVFHYAHNQAQPWTDCWNHGVPLYTQSSTTLDRLQKPWCATTHTIKHNPGQTAEKHKNFGTVGSPANIQTVIPEINLQNITTTPFCSISYTKRNTLLATYRLESLSSIYCNSTHISLKRHTPNDSGDYPVGEWKYKAKQLNSVSCHSSKCAGLYHHDPCTSSCCN
jgi:hypothetical protein